MAVKSHYVQLSDVLYQIQTVKNLRNVGKRQPYSHLTIAYYIKTVKYLFDYGNSISLVFCFKTYCEKKMN